MAYVALKPCKFAGQIFKIGEIRKYTAGRNLIIAVLIHQIEAFQIMGVALIGIDHFGGIIPIALKHFTGHFLKEFHGMLPNIVRPDPRPGIMLFRALQKIIEILPP